MKSKLLEELSRAIAEGQDIERTAVIDLPMPEIYYDGRNFHIPNSTGGWVSVDRTSVRQFLIRSGLERERADDESQSEVDAMLVRIQTEHDVEYVGGLAGYRAGIYTINHRRILVTSSPVFVEPKLGEFSVLAKLLQNLLGETQLPYFYGWLKVALEMYRSRIWRAGQILVLCGDVGAGKNLLRLLITILLGGRVAFPYVFMTDKTIFGSDLFEAETLAIEDQQNSTDIRARRNFGAAIKNITVNKDQRCEGKHIKALTLTPLWRLIVSLNNDPERVQVLPPIDHDIADKIMLFKVVKEPMPMSTDTLEQQAAFWQKLLGELPMLLHYLDSWQIPVALRCGRYGIKHYHDPELLDLLTETSPERHLLEMIYEELFPDDNLEIWEGSASALEAVLCGENSPCGAKARRLLTHTNSCGTYLGRLARKPESMVKRRTENGHTIWIIQNLKNLVKQGNQLVVRSEAAARRRRR